MSKNILKIAVTILLVIVLLVIAGSFTGFSLVRGSLARLDGQIDIAGLSSPVKVERDAKGVPTITAETRQDVAFGLGFLHAQDRFFQMDLSRRRAAGELAALLGEGLLDEDRTNRRHRFRQRADLVLAEASPGTRAILKKYTAGVNAGLADLRVRPFEYLLLRQKPVPWSDEDSVLVLYTMFILLNLDMGAPEAHWATVQTALPVDMAAYLLAPGNRFDSPIDGSHLPVVPIPPAGGPAGDDPDAGTPATGEDIPRADAAGSNNWAVAGLRSRHGGALVANDMHLSIGVPNTWYRVMQQWGSNGDDDGGQLAGVTLPGLPALVAGSNFSVAWGFTNSYGDWLDLILLEKDPTDENRYLTPEGYLDLETHSEIIMVAGQEPDTLRFQETIWGPIWDVDSQGQARALRWTAHDTGGANLNLLDLENARHLPQALALANQCGIPAQNFVCGDASGRIGWTIAGRIPNRQGFSGRLPVSWSDGQNSWQGYLPADDYPQVLDPDEGLLWSANSRVVGGQAWLLIGDGGYGLGARGAQIRDGLRALDLADEEDMLAIQLDDRALFLENWRRLLLAEFASVALPEKAQIFMASIGEDWSGRAEISSVSYRLLRDFRRQMVALIYDSLTAACLELDPEFQSWQLSNRDAVALDLAFAKPAHLLPDSYDTWSEAMVQTMSSVVEKATADDRLLADHTWGARNTTNIVHPFGYFIPQLKSWLSMPARQLPGGSHMPRVQHPVHGASQRFVVSPGKERSGIFHMPCGPSGHPLSPFFQSGHEDWETGAASPFMPGPGKHLLVMVPLP